MNVTVPTLAPLEDILVEEITEHERGACEIPHTVIVCPVNPVAYAAFKCDTKLYLCCAPYVAYVEESIARGELAECLECDRLCRDCWSVVMLP